jgi:hypothetical protein
VTKKVKYLVLRKAQNLVLMRVEVTVLRMLMEFPWVTS